MNPAIETIQQVTPLAPPLIHAVTDSLSSNVVGSVLLIATLLAVALVGWAWKKGGKDK